MRILERYSKQVSRSLINTTDTEIIKESKKFHIISLSRGDLQRNFGKETGDLLFSSLVSNNNENLKNIRGSKGVQISSISKLTFSDLAGVDPGTHLYYKRGEHAAIITHTGLSASVKVSELLTKLGKQGRLSSSGKNTSEGIDYLSNNTNLDVQVASASKTSLVEIHSKYSIKSSLVLALTKQVSKFLTEISIVVPQDSKLASRIVKKEQDKVVEELRKQSSLPIKTIESELSRMLNFMDEKFPNATAKSAAVVNRSYFSGNKSITTSVALKSSGVKSRVKYQAASSLDKVLAVLNKKLPPEVRRQMGSKFDPLSKKYLRNITGRFSNSVTVVGLSVTARQVTAFYNYQTNPYSVFSTRNNSKWSSRGRDPHNIIAPAIRNLLTSELARQNIGNLRVQTREVR